jgi:membrane dipeptidase
MRPIIDAHLDLAWNALSFNRDLTEPVATMREREKGMGDSPARGNCTVGFEEMRRGGVAVCVGTLLARAKREVAPSAGFKRTDLDVGTQEMASAVARGQLAYYDEMERRGEVRVIRSARELKVHCEGWSANAPIGVILSMEGADPIVEPKRAEWWWEQGLRAVGLVHYGKGHYAMGTGETGPLTGRGVELLKEFERLGMIVDLTHCCDESFFQALDCFGGRVLASHHNCRALANTERQLSDEQIKLLIERDAVIGVALDSWMLSDQWKRGQTPRETVTLETLANHIDRYCQLAGNCRHVGIGSDLDGGFGTEQSPLEIDTIADLQKLEPILSKRGYKSADIDAVFHGNWLRFFSEALPA